MVCSLSFHLNPIFTGHQALKNINTCYIHMMYLCVSYDKYILWMHRLLYLFFGHFTTILSLASVFWMISLVRPPVCWSIRMWAVNWWSPGKRRHSIQCSILCANYVLCEHILELLCQHKKRGDLVSSLLSSVSLLVDRWFVHDSMHNIMNETYYHKRQIYFQW